MARSDDDRFSDDRWVDTLTAAVADRVLNNPSTVTLEPPDDLHGPAVRVALDREDCAMIARFMDILRAALLSESPPAVHLERVFSLRVLVFNYITKGATRAELVRLANWFDQFAMDIRTRRLGHPHEPAIGEAVEGHETWLDG